MVRVIRLHVPLDMVPGPRRELGTWNRCVQPFSARFAPGVPNARRVVALSANHVVITANELERIVFKSLCVRYRRGIKLHVEVPEKIGHAIVRAHLPPPERVAPDAVFEYFHTG